MEEGEEIMLPFFKTFGWMLLKGVVYGLVALGLFWAVYVTFVKPHTNPTPTSEQNASSIYNLSPKVTFGCANFAIDKKGVSK